MSMSNVRGRLIFVYLLGLCLGPGLAARGDDNDPQARFRGAPTYDLAVTNVKWEVVNKDYTEVTFDLFWSHSWRTAWEEPAESNVTAKPLRFENWDAAWVFVKFLPEKDSREIIERNHWQHATLDTDARHHRMPAGAMNTVGPSADGSRGLGVYIYRDAIGYGTNDFKGVKLRWLHAGDSSTPLPSAELGAGKFDPARAALKVHAVAMVYVPEGPFDEGGYHGRVIPWYLDGPTVPMVFGGPGVIVDGSRHGGPLIPFQVDAEWNAPAAQGSRARRIGPFPGQLWGTLCYAERMAWGASVGPAGVLNDDFPTGYDAFYCMKYPLTQGQYVDFLNSLPPDVAAARMNDVGEGKDAEGAGGDITERTLDFGPGYRPGLVTERDGLTIWRDDIPKIPSAEGGVGIKPLQESIEELTSGEDAEINSLVEDMISDRTAKDGAKPIVRPPVYAARLPFRRCNYISTRDYFSYGVWAGLRPMTELEYTKALRGPIRDVSIGLIEQTRLPLVDEGLPTERYSDGNHPSYSFGSRVGSFATATSDRASSGATYWGILDFYFVQVVPLTSGRAFRAAPGDGRTPAGTPGAMLRANHDPIFDTAPADWPPTSRCGTKEGFSRVWVSGEHMGDSRKSGGSGRLVGNIKPRLLVDATERQAEPSASPASEATPVRADTVKVTNLKLETVTKEASTISFDLAWEDSWRAVWTEPAEQNVTAKPLKLESWDAVWVFVKFRAPGANEDGHVTLGRATADHQVPAGAGLEVGLTEDGERGVGVLVYRSAAARGPIMLRDVKLRWLHPSSPAATPGQAQTTFDPGKVELKVHAIEMVYIPEGPFKSKSPWNLPLTLIDTADATRPGGHVAADSNEVPINASWSNGYKPYYFMKHAISQAHYALLLNSMRSNRNVGRYSAGTYWCRTARYHSGLYGVNGFTIRYIPGEDLYVADVPDRVCNLLSWPDILSFAAWAGLRLPTNLEYEKACRGPREVAQAEAAWTPEACRPAAGIGPFDSAWTNGSYGASYWGIYGLSLSGNLLEWPGVFQRWSARDFAGSHGEGSPWAPGDWPWSAVGESVAKGQWFGTENTAIWLDPFQMERTMGAWEAVDAGRTGRFGARLTRTAPSDQAMNPMRMAALPNMRGFDVVIFPLSGSFRNDGESPLEVELVAPLPDVCFPEGAASRVFTAAPKAVTPFRILTALSSLTAADAVRGKGERLVFQLQTAGEKILAERTVRLFADDPKNLRPSAIGSLAGGDVALRIKNFTDRPHTAAITVAAPVGLRLGAPELHIQIEAGTEAQAMISIPRQGFAQEGVCRLPYRLTVEGSPPQSGVTATDLRNQSRWWVGRHVKRLPNAGEQLAGLTGIGDAPNGGSFTIITEAGAPTGVPDGFFKMDQPPPGWTTVVSAAGVPVAAAGDLPTRESSALAATWFVTRAAGAALMSATCPEPAEGTEIIPARVRVWLNEEVVFDSKLGPAASARSPAVYRVLLRAGANSLVVACESLLDEPTVAGDVTLTLLDAESGKPLSELILDMNKR